MHLIIQGLELFKNYNFSNKDITHVLLSNYLMTVIYFLFVSFVLFERLIAIYLRRVQNFNKKLFLKYLFTSFSVILVRKYANYY